MAKYRMTISEYEAELRRAVDAFVAHWRLENSKSPKDYPAALEAQNKASAILDWDEQFEAFREMEQES